VVADDEVDDEETSASAVTGPMLVGAAAEAPRRRGMGAGRAARAVDTGELDPVRGSDVQGRDVDPEEARYAPRPPRRFTWARRGAALALVAVLVAIVAIAGYKWTQSQYYVANDGDQVAIFRGVEADLPGIQMHRVTESSELTLDALPTYNARQVRDGISADSLEDARGIVSRLQRLVICPEPATPSPSASPSGSATALPKTSQPAPSAGASASPSANPSSSPSPTPTSPLCTEAP
jgi:protein phosphatase